MYIHEMVRRSIKENRKEIEISQQAMIAGISSLIYSEYLKRIVEKNKPVKRILVPTIVSVREVLDHHGHLMRMMSEKMIDMICQHDLFRQFKDAPEFKIFNQDNVEVFKTIFDLYIAQNISRIIPDVISRKFCLMDDSQQMFVENREADLFDRHPITDDQFRFIVDETVLQMLATIPSIDKDVDTPIDNHEILVTNKTVVGINHINAICPIYFDSNIIKNESVIHLLEFVTSTETRMIPDGLYSIRTSPSNEVSVMVFRDIKK